MIDVSNPAAPHEVASYETPGSQGQDLWVTGRTAYVAAHEAGLMVFELAR